MEQNLNIKSISFTIYFNDLQYYKYTNYNSFKGFLYNLINKVNKYILIKFIKIVWTNYNNNEHAIFTFLKNDLHLTTNSENYINHYIYKENLCNLNNELIDLFINGFEVNKLIDNKFKDFIILNINYE